MTTKKTFYSVYAILTLLVTGCAVDSNSLTSEPETKTNYVPNESVLKSFDNMFPNAKNITWERYDTYEVADFTEYNSAVNAWFSQQGEWLQSKTSVSTNKIPSAVTNAFAEGVYAADELKNARILERKDLGNVYILNVLEDNASSLNVYYSENGDLIKKAKENANNMDLPVHISDDVKAFITNYYPQAQIIDTWDDAIGIKVCVIDNHIYKVIALDSNANWISTIVNISEEMVPEVVMNGFKNSRHGIHDIQDIKYAYLTEENLYYFYFEADNKHKIATLQETGNLVATISY